MVEEGCSRFSTRQVRVFLEKEVYPRLPYPPEELPSSCQLNPLYDQFLDQERNKTEVSRSDYQCGLCGKHFRSEFYLDKHISTHHRVQLRGSGENRVCLGDLCPLFGCSVDPDSAMHQSYKAGRGHFNKDRRDRTGQTFGTIDEGCTSDSLERQVYKCETLMRKCFGDLHGDLQSQFSTNICGSLQCVQGMFKGSITQRGLSAEYLAGKPPGENSAWISSNSDDEVMSTEPAGSNLWYVLRMVIGGSLIVFIWFYIYFTGTSIPYLWERRHKAGEGARSSAQRAAAGSRWNKQQTKRQIPNVSNRAADNKAVRPSWFGGKKDGHEL